MAEPYFMKIIPKAIYDALLAEGYIELLENATSLSRLEQIIDIAIRNGVIPDTKMGDIVYDTYAFQVLQGKPKEVSPQVHLRNLGASDELINYLVNFTDEQDLSQRIGQLGLSQEESEGIFNNIMASETDYTKQQRKVYKGQMGDYQKQLAYQEQNRQEQETLAAPYRAQALSDIYNSPYLTQEDFAKYREMPLYEYDEKSGKRKVVGYQELSPDKFISTMQSIADQRARETGGLTRSESIMDMRKAGSGYRQESEAFLRAFSGSSGATKDKRIPPLPSMKPIVEEFQEGIGYAPGTRLRSFLESEIPKTIRGVQESRLAWHRRMNPEEEQTYEDERGRLGAQTKKYAKAFLNAPTESVIGGVYFGEGGPAAIARKAFESSFDSLYGLRPEDFGRRREIEMEEDPLKGALRNLQAGYKQRYYRQAGTGMVGRLQPALRFR